MLPRTIWIRRIWKRPCSDHTHRTERVSLSHTRAMVLFLFFGRLLRKIDDSFSFFLCIPHRLASSARPVFHIENHQIAPIHYLLVADLIGPLGVTVLGSITNLNFVVIVTETFFMVPQLRCGVWQHPYQRAVVCSYAALKPLYSGGYDLVKIPLRPTKNSTYSFCKIRSRMSASAFISARLKSSMMRCPKTLTVYSLNISLSARQDRLRNEVNNLFPIIYAY